MISNRPCWLLTPANWNGQLLCWFTVLVVVAAFQQPGWSQHSADEKARMIGEVTLIKGGVVASSESRIDRDLIAGQPVYIGDVIETDRRSFVAIRFIDGGKLTLQPSSKIDLQEFNYRDSQESQTFELLKGGLRAVTGAIGKHRPNQVTYFGQGVTIGIRGTAFAMRLCAPGAPRCKFDRGINFQGRIVANRPDGGEVRIFVRDRDSDRRRRITPEDLGQYLKDTFVGVIEGKIRVLTDAYAIDMEVVNGLQGQPQASEPGPAPPLQQPARQPAVKQPVQNSKKAPPPPRGGGQ